MSNYEKTREAIGEWQGSEGMTDATLLAEAMCLLGQELRLSNLINWYHAVPQPNPDGNVLRDRIEKELDLT